MNILLVDQDLDIQQFVASLLGEAGHTVLCVNEGLSGLDAAIAEKPDMILADSSLQGLEIADFVARIRRRDFLKTTPIFLLSGETEACSVPLDSLKIQAILHKPIDPTLLIHEVTKQRRSVEPPPPVTTTSSSPRFQEATAEAVNNGVTHVLEELQADDFLRKTILDVVEKVSWEVIPGVIEAALPKEAVHAIVERVVWETVPPLAEIQIKKEIQRLQSE